MPPQDDQNVVALLGKKLDTLIVLIARSLYGESKLQDVVVPMSNAGMTAKQIAAVLDVSPKTVSNRLAEARRRRGIAIVSGDEDE